MDLSGAGSPSLSGAGTTVPPQQGYQNFNPFNGPVNPFGQPAPQGPFGQGQAQPQNPPQPPVKGSPTPQGGDDAAGQTLAALAQQTQGPGPFGYDSNMVMNNFMAPASNFNGSPVPTFIPPPGPSYTGVDYTGMDYMGTQVPWSPPEWGPTINPPASWWDQMVAASMADSAQGLGADPGNPDEVGGYNDWQVMDYLYGAGAWEPGSPFGSNPSRYTYTGGYQGPPEYGTDAWLEEQVQFRAHELARARGREAATPEDVNEIRELVKGFIAPPTLGNKKPRIYEKNLFATDWVLDEYLADQYKKKKEG